MTKARWDALYSRVVASHTTPVAGYYNRNYIIAEGDARMVLRVPIASADEMDIRLLPEHAVLKRARDAGLHVPEVLAVSDDPAYQIHEFVPGLRLDELAARGAAVPRALLTDIGHFFGVLWSTSHDGLRMPTTWPASGDTPGFFKRLIAQVQGVYDASHSKYGSLFEAVEVPTRPLAEVKARNSTLGPREFALIHCDVHRKNCVVAGSIVWYLDWELALIGDPVYDLAVHLHKMAYVADDEAFLLRAIAERCREALGDRWEADLAVYRAFEQLKSVLVDTVRYSKQVRDPRVGPSLRRTLIDKWREKLSAAQPHWGNRVPDEDEAAGLLSGRGIDSVD